MSSEQGDLNPPVYAGCGSDDALPASGMFTRSVLHQPLGGKPYAVVAGGLGITIPVQAVWSGTNLNLRACSVGYVVLTLREDQNKNCTL